MGFFKKIFRKTEEVHEESELDLLEKYIDDDTQRKKKVSSSLMQMKEISGDIDNLQAEYDAVTDYLNDCDEFDRLPDDIYTPIKDIAEQLIKIRDEKKKYYIKEPLMDEVLYDTMDKLSDTIPDAIKKIEETEEYQEMIKSDLRKVEGEKQAYNYRARENAALRSNLKTVLIVSTVSALLLFVVLLVLRIVLELNVTIGFLIAATVLITVYCFLFLKSNSLRKEAQRIDKTVVKIIKLQNSIKIRLVNNTNLLDYLYIKYDIYSSKELKDNYNLYLSEKERRDNYDRASKELPSQKRLLLSYLTKLHLYDPVYWVHSPECIIDKKERVEVRHELIGRRQDLRERISQCSAEAEKLRDELKEIIKKYPKYSVELMSMIEDFDK